MYQGPPPPAYPGTGDHGTNGAYQAPPPSYQSQPVAYAQPVAMAAAQPIQYAAQPAAYAQPMAYAQPVSFGTSPTSGTGLLAASYITVQDGSMPVATAVSLPSMDGGGVVPVYQAGKARDVWAAALFWAHALAIVGVAFALGTKAVSSDASTVENDPNRRVLDVNAWTILKVVLVSCAVGGATSATAFACLRRAGGAMIRISMWVNFFVLAAAALALSIVALPAGIIMAIPAVLTLVYMRCVRNRIAFAAAHLQTACDALSSSEGSSIFAAAVAMLGVQTAWNALWSLAAVGVHGALEQMAANATATSLNDASGAHFPGRLLLGGDAGLPAATLAATASSTSTSGDQPAAIAMFLMLISFYWGSQVFSNITHFTTATVVGSWWFGPAREGGRNPVWAGLKRAWTTSFGSIAFGSLIVAVLRALEVAARSAERNAARQNKPGAAFAAACLLCLLSFARRAVEYLNHWAYIYCALTGCAFVDAGRSAWGLFKDRGWTAVINDDLVGFALGLSNLMVASVSTVAGACLVYVSMAANPDRALIAAVAGVFSFVIGLAMSAVMNSVLTSAVRTIFVCFAINPAALASSHPSHLAALASAWATFHPEVWAQCGYAVLYPAGAPVAVNAKL